MERFVRPMKRHLQRARGMERFVRLIVVGGIGLITGLWLVTLSGTWSVPWLLGAALVLLGVGGLGGGIQSEINY